MTNYLEEMEAQIHRAIELIIGILLCASILVGAVTLTVFLGWR